MPRIIVSLTIIVLCAATGMGQGRNAAPATAAPIKACSLLPKELAEKYFQNKKVFPYLKPSEEAVGPKGSSCDYGSIHMQVDPFARPDEIRKTRTKDQGWEPVSGVGDAAFFHNNKDRFAELMVWTGSHHVTIQMDINDGRTAENTKPDTIAVANAVIGKLK